LKEKKIPSFSPFPIFFHKTEILKIQLQLITNLDKKFWVFFSKVIELIDIKK